MSGIAPGRLGPGRLGPGRFELGPALLFCPADRPDRYAKAAARADAVILDLEDAVAAAAKPEARRSLGMHHHLEPDRTIVRVNPVGTPDLAEDLRALEPTPFRTVMLAKTDDAGQVRQLCGYGTGSGYDVVALVETPAGVLHAAEIAAEPSVVALMWGAEDLVASLGGTSSRHPDGSYRDVARQARCAVLLAAGAYGKAAIDAVHLDIPDLDGLAAEARDAAAGGFCATACIHPSQVDVVRAAYRPSEDDVRRARDLLEASAAHRGAFLRRGRMVDGPVLKQAATVVERAGRGSERER